MAPLFTAWRRFRPRSIADLARSVGALELRAGAMDDRIAAHATQLRALWIARARMDALVDLLLVAAAWRASGRIRGVLARMSALLLGRLARRPALLRAGSALGFMLQLAAAGVVARHARLLAVAVGAHSKTGGPKAYAELLRSSVAAVPEAMRIGLSVALRTTAAARWGVLQLGSRLRWDAASASGPSSPDGDGSS